MLANDLESSEELLRVNDSRITILFFAVKRDNIKVAWILAANSLNPRKVTLKRFRENSKVSTSPLDNIGPGVGSTDGNDYDRHSRILA